MTSPLTTPAPFSRFPSDSGNSGSLCGPGAESPPRSQLVPTPPSGDQHSPGSLGSGSWEGWGPSPASALRGLGTQLGVGSQQRLAGPGVCQRLPPHLGGRPPALDGWGHTQLGGLTAGVIHPRASYVLMVLRTVPTLQGMSHTMRGAFHPSPCPWGPQVKVVVV